MSPATLQPHPFLQAHLPHVQGSGRPSGFVFAVFAAHGSSYPAATPILASTLATCAGI